MKKVLFLCVGNSCRSQMAEGFARVLGKGIIEPSSAGTKPASSVSTLAIEVMREKGIDISGQRPKALTADLVESADILISMGCGVEKSCPAIYLEMFEDWAIEDPYRKPIEEYRIARDKIEEKVQALVRKLEK
ncbi:MAG: arsenate reductase ArsC [Thermoplasmata archaeon]|nr:arsenate reductase ArsC [Thermoplasmata archaeon]